MPLQCHAVLCCHVFYGCVYPHSLLPWLIVTYGWMASPREDVTKVMDRVQMTPTANTHISPDKCLGGTVP